MTTVEDVKPLDRAKVSRWVFDLFGTTDVLSASFHPNEHPRAEVIVKEPTQGRIARELCDLLDLDPSEVRGVNLNKSGAEVLIRDERERDGVRVLVIPFRD